MVGGYKKGARFEREVRDFLEDNGWDVTRSAGSHTVKDLVAVKPGPVVWYVQCKTDGNLKPEEREALREFEKTLGIVPMLAYKMRGKLVFEWIKSKVPDFHYELVNGEFTKVANE